jgi:hypothetical protein
MMRSICVARTLTILLAAFAAPALAESVIVNAKSSSSAARRAAASRFLLS